MKRKWFTRLAAALIVPAWLLGSIVGLSPLNAFAAPVGVQLPLDDATPYSVFNPNHLYLDSGTVNITARAGAVLVTVSTSATQVVDSIGITVYVQKWNGSAWENFGSGNTYGGNETSYYTNSVVKSVTPGYYYRVRSIHWVIENGVYEEGEKFTASVLVS